MCAASGRDYLATCTTQPWDFSKMVLACWDTEINGNAAVNLSSTEEAGLKPRVLDTSQHPPRPSRNIGKSPFRFMAQAHSVWNATQQHVLFSLHDQYCLGGAAVFLQALHVGDCNSFLFISPICNALDWMWSRCSITPPVKTLTFIMGPPGNLMLSSWRGKVLGVFQIACLCTFVQKYEAAISDAGSVTIW